MKPISGAMLVVAALLTSPALAGAALGELPVDVALVRYLVVAVSCWVVLTLASEWLLPDPSAGVAETTASSPDASAPAPDAPAADS